MNTSSRHDESVRGIPDSLASGGDAVYAPWLWFWIVLGMMWFICAVALPSKPWWAGREGREPCGAGCVMFERQEYPPQTEWHCHKSSGNRSFPAK